MAGAEAKKTSLAVEDDPKIVGGTLEGLAEHRPAKARASIMLMILKPT